MISNLSHALQVFQLPLSIGEAKEYLEQVRSVTEYLVVYQHYFPAEYAQSMKLVDSGTAPLFPEPGHAYSPHEIRFLKLVDQYLFPLPLWYVFEERYITIPIEPFGIDLYTGDDFAELDIGWQLMYYLVAEIDESFIPDALGDEWDGPLPIEPRSVDYAWLAQMCQREREPLSSFCDALNMITNDTGTVWLDATQEVPCDTADWSIETIDELIRQYEEARSIKEKADQFIGWLESDLVPNFKEAVQLWNTCIKN